jgi:hypothetical protein
MRKTFLAAGAALAVISTAAIASVSVDNTGHGFVGKGDVQLAFGWNNAALQRNAAGVTFTYDTSSTYDAVCTFTTGEGTRGERIHNIHHTKHSGVIATVAYDARQRNQITGFILNGFSTPTEGGDPIPVVGGPCPGNQGTDGTWSSVTLTGEGGTGLSVNYGGVSVPLPNTPVI